MQKETNYASIFSAITLIIVVVLGLMAINGNFTPEVPTIPTAQEIVDAANIPTAEEITSAIGTNDEILAILNEDDNWETAAIAIATDELGDNDYGRLANQMRNNPYTEIRINKDNIYEVVIKETEVVSAEVDDGDALIYFKLYVHYDDGSDRNWDRRATVYVSVEIEDGEANKLNEINRAIFNSA